MVATSVAADVPSRLIAICFSAAVLEPVPVVMVAPVLSILLTAIVVSAVEVVPALTVAPPVAFRMVTEEPWLR